MVVKTLNSFFHLSGIMLRPGSIIEPGNFGRITRAIGVNHTHWHREQALEAARLRNHPHKPSRLAAAFASIDEREALSFRARIPGFAFHMLYRVSLVDPEAHWHLTDSRLCDRQGQAQYDWADMYWHEYDPKKIVIPGLGTLESATSGISCRELLTLSALQIEEVLQ
ncbi:hypothetical protein ACVWXO_004132 [Bradyrhizobium sp. LM2.7]